MGQLQDHKNPQGRLHPPLSELTNWFSNSNKYVNPLRNSYLMEALHALTQKNAVERSKIRHLWHFSTDFSWSQKPNNKGRLVLDLNSFNKYLKSEKLKMETPESIRTSLQKGEWVTSIGFKDTLLPYPNKPTAQEIPASCPGSILPVPSSTILSVHCSNENLNGSQGSNLMAHNKGIRIHQYLDNWLVRAPSDQLDSIILKP